MESLRTLNAFYRLAQIGFRQLLEMVFGRLDIAATGDANDQGAQQGKASDRERVSWCFFLGVVWFFNAQRTRAH